MDAKDYLQRFDGMVRDLNQREDIQLLTYAILPAEDGAIDMAEAILGYPLGEPVRDFYRNCGGIQLRWIHKESKYHDPDKTFFVDGPLDWAHELAWDIGYGELIGTPNDWEEGRIMLAPLSMIFADYARSCFANAPQDGIVTLRDKSEHDLAALWVSVRPVDAVSYGEVMFFLPDTRCPDMKLTLSDDNFCNDLDQFFVTTFPSYLEFLLYSRGLTNGRALFYTARDWRSKEKGIVYH